MNKDVNAITKYFTREKLDLITEMTDEEMKNFLKELEGTKYWVAINKYNQQRLNEAQNGLITLDPFKDPTKMARYQGIMSGISDLTDAIITLKDESEKKIDPSKKIEDAKEDLGGAYGVI